MVGVGCGAGWVDGPGGDSIRRRMNYASAAMAALGGGADPGLPSRPIIATTDDIYCGRDDGSGRGGSRVLGVQSESRMFLRRFARIVFCDFDLLLFVAAAVPRSRVLVRPIFIHNGRMSSSSSLQNVRLFRTYSLIFRSTTTFRQLYTTNRKSFLVVRKTDPFYYKRTI